MDEKSRQLREVPGRQLGARLQQHSNGRPAAAAGAAAGDRRPAPPSHPSPSPQCCLIAAAAHPLRDAQAQERATISTPQAEARATVPRGALNIRLLQTNWWPHRQLHTVSVRELAFGSEPYREGLSV